MRICHVGLNHRSATVELREKLSVPEHEVADVLQHLMSHPPVREVAMISTCNRVEITVVTHDPDAAIANIHKWFAQRSGLPAESLQDKLYTLIGEAAIEHLFSVATGLDSLILGEPQILGQVKASYEHALNAGTAGHILHRLYHCTFAAAKRARSETGIGRLAVNISSCAVDLARHIFGSLEGKTVMIVGAGEMAELAYRHLHANGCTNVLVANRTLEHAQNMAIRFSGHALSLDQLDSYLDAADIVISSTGANTFVILPENVRMAMDKRRGCPILLIDIAVPRDIDPRVGEIDGVYLYDIDDLQMVVDGNLEQRKQEAEKARSLLQSEAQAFLAWLKSLESVPLIRSIQQRAEQIRDEELTKAKSRYLKHLDAPTLEAVERFSRALMKRFMHEPMQMLKSLPNDIEGDLLMGAAKKLFGLEQNLPKKEQPEQERDERTS